MGSSLGQDSAYDENLPEVCLWWGSAWGYCTFPLYNTWPLCFMCSHITTWHERLARAGSFYATYHWSQWLLKITPWGFLGLHYWSLFFAVPFFLKTDSWHSKVLTDVVSALLIVSLASSRLYIAPSVGPPVLYWETYRQRPLDPVCRDRDIPPSQETNHGSFHPF